MWKLFSEASLLLGNAKLYLCTFAIMNLVSCGRTVSRLELSCSLVTRDIVQTWHLFSEASRHGAAIKLITLEYAVKAQTSLAPLSRFRGSHVTTAHAHQCCRFQSYARTVPLRMKLTTREPTFLGSMTMDHVITACRRLTSTAYCQRNCTCALGLAIIQTSYPVAAFPTRTFSYLHCYKRHRSDSDTCQRTPHHSSLRHMFNLEL